VRVNELGNAEGAAKKQIIKRIAYFVLEQAGGGVDSAQLLVGPPNHVNLLWLHEPRTRSRMIDGRLYKVPSS
jgi:hypothetical protein